jgi:hypothetical protein
MLNKNINHPKGHNKKKHKMISERKEENIIIQK